MTQQCACRNGPTWSDDVITRNWDALERALPAEWLPHLKCKQQSFEEYGCGNWGCVYPTDDVCNVFKITTDESEVDFVALALRLPWPEGIVRYQTVMQLEGMTRAPIDDFKLPRKVYALVREAADGIGTFKPKPPDKGTDTRWRSIAAMRLFKEAAEHIRGYIKNAEDGGTMLLAQAAEHLREHGPVPAEVLRAGGQFTPLWLERNERRPDDLVVHVSYREEPYLVVLKMHTALEVAAWMLSKEPDTELLAEAMRQYLDWGLMMCDLHFKNVGLVNRHGRMVWAITDPGHVVRLRDDVPVVGIRHVRDFARTSR